MSQPKSRREFLKQCGCCALLCAGADVFFLSRPADSRARQLKKGLLGVRLSPYFTPLEEGRIRCDLCPHECEVSAGARGLCGVRENRDGRYYSLVYGNPCAVHVDPIEKKPFFHVLPASRSFSIATAGCNFTCKFCQNWEISQANPDETHNYDLPPEKVVRLALEYDCRSIASTYVEPTIFLEYMIEMGRLARKKGMLKVMHSNGFINERPLDDLCRNLDAACIDLKGFTESYYREVTGGELQPVLETLKGLKARKVHTELVNLMLPGKNDDMEQVKSMCRWIRDELGPDVPLHFSRFYPTYKMKGLPPTPVATLEKARQAALGEGLEYVYIGNVPGHDAEHTYCPQCGKKVIERSGYRIQAVRLEKGRCKSCGHALPGIWSQEA